MSIEIIKSVELENKLVKDGYTVVNFFATWCGPCKMLAPTLEELSSDVKVLKLDIDQNSEFARTHQIQSIPTTFIYKNGSHIDTISGFVPKEVLQSKLQ